MKSVKSKTVNMRNKNIQNLTEIEESNDLKIPTQSGVNGWNIYLPPSLSSSSSSSSSVPISTYDEYVHEGRGTKKGNEINEDEKVVRGRERGRGGVLGQGGYQLLFSGKLPIY